MLKTKIPDGFESAGDLFYYPKYLCLSVSISGSFNRSLSPVFLCDEEVAEETVAFGAEEGGAGESLFEGGVVQGFQQFC